MKPICPEMSKPIVTQTFPRSLAVLTVNCSEANCGKWRSCTANKGLDNLKAITNTQCTKGNYDQGEYMRGMANGMLLAVATMEGKEPVFFEKG